MYIYTHTCGSWIPYLINQCIETIIQMSVVYLADRTVDALSRQSPAQCHFYRRYWTFFFSSPLSRWSIAPFLQTIGDNFTKYTILLILVSPPLVLWCCQSSFHQGEVLDLGQAANWTVSSSRVNISVPASVPGGIYSDLRQVRSHTVFLRSLTFISGGCFEPRIVLQVQRCWVQVYGRHGSFRKMVF